MSQSQKAQADALVLYDNEKEKESVYLSRTNVHILTASLTRSADAALRCEYLDPIISSSLRIGSSIVKLIAGKEEEVFHADKAILCKESLFFNRAFNGGFLESCSEIRLPEESPTTVYLLMSWMYSKNIGWFYGRFVPSECLSDGDILEFFRLFNAAEKLCMISLAKAAATTIIQWQVHHEFCRETLLPAAFSVAIADHLQTLLFHDIAWYCRNLVFSSEALPMWLTDFLEANPSIAPKVLVIQSKLASKILYGVVNHGSLADGRSVFREMVKDIFRLVGV